MKVFGAILTIGLAATSASAQTIIPLGAPVLPQTKSAAPPPSSQDQSGRAHAARPLGSNYSPYSIQPLGSVQTAAPSSAPADKQVSSSVVTDPNAPEAGVRKPSKPKSAQQSDMAKLAPTAPERTDMTKADADAPPKR